LYVIYIAMFMADNLTIGFHSAQIICCLVPPLALQIGSGSFLKSYSGISTSAICGIMFADIFIYTALAWYFSQVWPTKVGVARPWYFLFLRSYWFPHSAGNPHSCLTQDVKVGAAEDELVIVEGSEGTIIPNERVNETLLGLPTVAVSKLKKTYGDTTVVNDLTFNMYENQIFALLGHNGAGKVRLVS
jgi:ABC-type multidrug transport system fused ATPase/permease subunit